MRAVQVTGAGRAELVALPEPKPEAGEVLVRVRWAAVGHIAVAWLVTLPAAFLTAAVLAGRLLLGSPNVTRTKRCAERRRPSRP
jgi:phosphate/sulfate permease